jgi:hypothetical protein
MLEPAAGAFAPHSHTPARASFSVLVLSLYADDAVLDGPSMSPVELVVIAFALLSFSIGLGAFQ